jgi:hypothetical protein
MKEQILQAYVQQCLETQEGPKNVYVFAKSLGIEEKEFYTYYASLEAVEQDIFSTWFKQVKEEIEHTEVYAGYMAREKFLAFYFAWIEALKGHRSFVTLLYKRKTEGMPVPQFPVYLKNLKEHFIDFSKGIINEGIAGKEIEERKFLSDKYADAMWLNLLFVMHFWIKDDSSGFEKTDAAIEKSVNLAFDLMGKSPLDSLLDFGKFIFQNR